jgi:protoporphyrinogen oxidase
VKTCGRRTVEKLWKPLLDSKFDGRFDDLPATYMWGRTRRMSATRDSAGREIMGWLEGGYQRLVEALARRIRALGGEIHAGTAVERVVGTASGIAGVVLDGRLRPFDHVLCTLLPPQAQRLLAPELAAATPADHCRYLGVVCVLLRTSRSVSPYYTLNITDRRVPLTTVVETTHVVDPAHVGGSILYAAKYADPGHPDLGRPEDEVEREYVGHVRTMFPGLADEEILASVVQRARVVEPVHVVGGAKRLPPLSPVPGLTLASTAHVYPEIVNGQAVIGVADRAVAGILDQLPLREDLAA